MDETEEKAIDRMHNLRSELQDMRSDISELKDTYSNDKGNAKQHTAYVLEKNKKNLLGLGILAFVAYIWISPEIAIPESVWVITAGLIAGVFFGYIPAMKVVEMFITDNRKPVIVIDPQEFSEDFQLYYVPQERIPQIEKYGEANEVETIKGKAYEVAEFAQLDNDGKEVLLWEGTWIGEKSGFEIKKDEANITGMKENLKPHAQTGFAYEVMWPHIMQDMQNTIANMFAREFEGVALFKGNNLRSNIDEVVEKYAPDNITERIGDNESDSEMKDVSEIAESDLDNDLKIEVLDDMLTESKTNTGDGE